MWTADSIEDFPALVDEFKRGSVTLFAGAGFSSNAGLPRWDQVMRPLSIELGLNPDTEPVAAAQYYSDAHVRGRELLVTHIVRQLTAVEPKFSHAHTLIKELPLRAVVTTNFDNLIESALRGSPERPHHVIASDQDLSNHSGQDLAIVKASGCIARPGSLVLTREDFDSYTQSRPDLTGYLRNLLATSTWLFLGTSPKDPAFTAFETRVLPRLAENRRQFYSVVLSTNKYEVQDFRARGIELIDLDADPDELGDSLALFLDSLVRLIKPKPQAPGRSRRREVRPDALLNSRLGPGLSLRVDPDHVDRIHRYSLVERTDLLDYKSSDFVSLRRLSGTNTSDLLSTHLVYSESSERKLSFAHINVMAFDATTREPLAVEPLDDKDVQMYTHGYKIFFSRPLSPGESFDIVYRITLKGELLDLSSVDEVMSISLARITHGVAKLRFNICLNFLPQRVAIECLDTYGSRMAAQGGPTVSSFEPAEWYERELNIKWSAEEPAIIRWECTEPQGKLYIMNYRA